MISFKKNYIFIILVDLYASLSRFFFWYPDPDQRFLIRIRIRIRIRRNDTDPTGSGSESETLLDTVISITTLPYLAGAMYSAEPGEFVYKVIDG